VASKIRHSNKTSLQCLSTINIVFSDEDKILIKKFVLEGVHSNEVDRQIFRKKAGVRLNKLLKKLRNTGTVGRLPGSSRPRIASTEENNNAFICLNISNILLTHKYTQHKQFHT